MPHSQLQLTPTTDAGHVLGRFCMGAPSIFEDDEKAGNSEDSSVEDVKRYEFAVEMTFGPSIFSLTKVSPQPGSTEVGGNASV